MREVAFTEVLPQILSVGYNPWISCLQQKKKERRKAIRLQFLRRD